MVGVGGIGDGVAEGMVVAVGVAVGVVVGVGVTVLVGSKVGVIVGVGVGVGATIIAPTLLHPVSTNARSHHKITTCHLLPTTSYFCFHLTRNVR